MKEDRRISLSIDPGKCVCGKTNWRTKEYSSASVQIQCRDCGRVKLMYIAIREVT